jgi:hypothetical protein
VEGASQAELRQANQGRSPMAKGQMRSTKEKKKPKAENAKKKKSAPTPLTSSAVGTKKA